MNNIYFYIHFIELKKNFFIYFYLFLFHFIICYFFSDQIIYLIINKLIIKNYLKYFIFTNITEILIIKIISSLILTYIYTFPFFIIQFWFFISKGLYKIENFLFIKNFLFFYIFFNINMYLFINYIIPNTFIFFFNFEKINNEFIFNIFLEPKLYDFLIFILNLLIYIHIFFQIPLILYILLKYKKINYKIILKFRKIFYLIFLIISSIISPPDILNQIILFFPFIILFEIFNYLIFLNNSYLNFLKNLFK